jgi:hypothetical protein
LRQALQGGGGQGQPIITRRDAIVAAGALGATAALTGVRTVQAASGEAEDAVVGTWVIAVTSLVHPGQPFTSIVALGTGGILTTTDNQGPGNTSLGAWDHDGGRGFEAVFDSFAFNPSGKFAGTAIIHPRGSVDGDDIHGTFTVDFKPKSGPVQHGIDHGTFRGSRLRP